VETAEGTAEFVTRAACGNHLQVVGGPLPTLYLTAYTTDQFRLAILRHSNDGSATSTPAEQHKRGRTKSGVIGN
jgi:hypothetical protein